MRKYLLIVLILLLSGPIIAQIGGYALKFDGTDDYVSIADNASIDFTSSQSYTIEAWIYADDLTASNTGRAVLSKYNGSDASYFIRVNPNGTLYFDNLYTSSGVITTNKWYHIACVYKAGSDAYRKVFVNGTEKTFAGGSVIGPNNGNDEPLKIGRHNDWANDWFGKIDEVRIWNTFRTEAEIKANMYKELTGNETNLVAYYKMSNGSGTDLADNQTSGTNPGTINGSTWAISGCFAGSRQALSFVDDANPDEYVEIENGSALIANQSGITFECWVYPRTATIGNWQTDFEGLMSIRNSSTHPAFYLLRIGNNTVEGNIVVSTGTSKQVNCSLVPNEWQHFALVYNGSTISIYRNGVLENSGAITGQITNTTQPLHIGKMFYDSYNWPFDGLIDEARVWTTARTESEIRENMMTTLNGNETGLVAYYRFDQYDGTTLYNIAGTGYNGTINNMESSDWVASTAFNTWIGSENSTWSTAKNWSSGTAPVSTDNIGLYKWDLGNETTISGTPTVNNLLFSSTASPTLSSDYSVNGSLLLGRDLDISGRQITLGSSGYLVEGNYRLYGTSGTITTTRTLGTLSTSTNVAGLGFGIKSTGNLGSTTITRGLVSQSGSYLTNGVSRYFDVTAAGGGPYDIVFNYLDAEVPGTESNLALFKSSDAGSTWTILSVNLNTTSNTISFSGTSSMSRWTAADNNSPLPVELSSLTAKALSNSVIINWKTSTEVNNYGFEVERSLKTESDMVGGSQNPEWDKIGFVPGAGNSNSPKEYSFTDDLNDASLQSQNHKILYRLKQIDNDGTFSYSKEAEIENLRLADFELSQNYPNPFNPTTTIKFGLPADTRVTLEVFNITGEKVSTLVSNEMKSAGYYEVQFNGSELSSGVYFYKLLTENGLHINKMMLMK